MKHRIDDLLHELVESLDLNVDGMSLLTEAATGAYLYTPILTALASADQVYAVTDDSPYARKEEVRDQTKKAAAAWGVEDQITVVYEKTPDVVGEVDIVTNTGFVRPIDSEMISWMKPTAVIPLMWEPWEFTGEIDIDACVENDILVMGTDESAEPTDMYPYGGYLAMKLLFELGLEGYKTDTLLLASGEGLGHSIYDHFSSLDMPVTWFSDREEEARNYDRLPDYFDRNGAQHDAILVAEHHSDRQLLGADGTINYQTIQETAPHLSIGVISGNVDVEGLANSGLNYYPKEIKPQETMSYQAFHLGPRGPLELYAAGLKVGQVMAECRRQGMDLAEAKEATLNNAPALAFDKEQAER